MSNPDIQKQLQEHQESDYHGRGLGPYIQDIVYGANDGIVTTFAVVSGVNGAALAHSIVVIMGFANLFADGVSMGMGNYLSLKSRRDHYHRTLKEEFKEIHEIPRIEREEIRQIYAAKGFSGADLDCVTNVITSNEQVWADTMMREEHGLSWEESENPVLHGFITFLSFVLFGSISIIPYLLPVPDESRFTTSIIATGLALVVLGLVRSWVTKERIFRGPLEILGVGSVCALIAYGVGVALKGLSGGAL